MPRGTKTERHLAHFRETGQMTPWLAKRMEWDTRLTERLLLDMWGVRDNSIASLNEIMKKAMLKSIKEQFEKVSAWQAAYLGEAEK